MLLPPFAQGVVVTGSTGDPIRCASCNHDNSGDALFCDACGAKLDSICATCGTTNQPDARFCKKCGTRIATESAPAKPAAAPTAPNIRVTPESSSPENFEGERKTVTALFADIKGSTELMAELDPEEARAIIDPALRLMIDAVHCYDGYVAQSTGDGIFALFGAPVAHEDHPQRALYAALRLQEDLKRYSEPHKAGRPVTTAGAGRSEYWRGCGAFDHNRRGTDRVHSDWAYDEPGLANSAVGANRFHRSD